MTGPKRKERILTREDGGAKPSTHSVALEEFWAGRRKDRATPTGP